MWDKRTEASHKRDGVPRRPDLIDHGGVGEPDGEELEDVVRDGDSLHRLEEELDEDGEFEEVTVFWEGDVVQVCADEIYLLVSLWFNLV